jgi:hypothetical protein
MPACLRVRLLPLLPLLRPSLAKPARSKCLVKASYVVWVGQRCGPDLNSVVYTGIYAIDSKTRQVKRVSGRDCVLRPDSSKAAAWNFARFGSCGYAPTYAAGLATTVCPPSAGSMSQDCLQSSATAEANTGAVTTMLQLASPVVCGSRASSTLTYSGVPCGPANQYVLWTRASDSYGCSLLSNPNLAGQLKQNNDVFGSCGVPPALSMQQSGSLVCSPGQLPSPAPAASPPSPPSGSSPAVPNPTVDGLKMPRSPVAAGEQVPTGVARIGGITGQTIADAAILPDSMKVVVGIIDSGVDASHPDINYVGGRSWISNATGSVPDDALPGKDFYGAAARAEGPPAGGRHGRLCCISVGAAGPALSSCSWSPDTCAHPVCLPAAAAAAAAAAVSLPLRPWNPCGRHRQ